MRITQNYNIEALLRRVNDSRERIYTLQHKLATGKRINSISDDPEHIESVKRFKKMLSLNMQFEENLKNAVDFMGISSQALDDAANVIATVKELAVKGVNNLSVEEWNSYAEQTDQMLREIVDLANTRFKDRYVFGGTNTSVDPFTLAPDGSVVSANPNGIDGALKTEIGEHKIDRYNASGQDVFLEGVDVFQTMIDLRDAFIAQDSAAVQSLLPTLDQAADQILQQNATLGAKINRYELYVQQYQTQDIKIQESLSDIEDTDIPRAITELQIQETGLQTALQVLARTLNISLVDFMS